MEQNGAEDFLNDVTFTGSVTDTSTGLQYMNSRYYNPETSRFLSQDTYSGNPYDPWTQHLYSYCGNNPVNMVDPTGHIWYYGNTVQENTTSFAEAKAEAEAKAAAEPDEYDQDKYIEGIDTGYMDGAGPGGGDSIYVPNTITGYNYKVVSNWQDYVKFTRGAESAKINPEFLGRLGYMGYKEGLVFIAGYGYRSNALQDSLNSVEGGTSWHNYGLAVDCKATKVLSNNNKYPRGHLKADGIFEKYGLCREAKDTETGEWEWWHITPIECYPVNKKGDRRHIMYKYDRGPWARKNATYPGQPWS